MKIDVEFIPDTHVYLANGILCPSVSELIRFKFPEAYAGIPKKILKQKANYGTKVHDYVERFIKKELKLAIAKFQRFDLIETEINVGDMVLISEGNPLFKNISGTVTEKRSKAIFVAFEGIIPDWVFKNDIRMDLFVNKFLSISSNKKIHKNKVRVKAVGKLELFSEDVRAAIEDAEKSTEHYDKRLINIAMGYDGRVEIVDAFKNIAQQVKEGKIEPEEINEDMINDNLYTAGLEDPNLVIRTSGEERLSGFLLWQSSYSELYFTDSLWPELRKVDFLRAIRSYTKRQRRFGR